MNIENDLDDLSPAANERGWLDSAGAAASWLCAVHCLALPFTVTLLPIIGLSFLLEETTERVFIGVSITLAALSLLPAYFRQHGKIRAIAFFSAGIGLIVTSHLLFEESLILKAAFLVIGAVLISAAHLVNRRLCRECGTCRVVADKI